VGYKFKPEVFNQIYISLYLMHACMHVTSP